MVNYGDCLTPVEIPQRHPLRLLLLSLPLCFCTNLAFADALAKITAEKLEATHKAVEALKAARQELARPGPYQDFRANMHVHSAFSHDSRGTIEDIVGAAKSVGTRVLMFTEHPSDKYDYFKDGHRGIRDGVLLIPGAETDGFLVFPTQSMKGVVPKQPQEFSDLVRGRGGLTFVSHLEERMKWDIQGVTGNEIYNTHANFKNQKQLIQSLRNPLWIFKSAELIRKYPQETFGRCKSTRKTICAAGRALQRGPTHGVAANDSHQNVGIVARAGEGTAIIIEDALAEKVAADAMKVPLLAPLLVGEKPGDVIFQVRLRIPMPTAWATSARICSSTT